jgi:hypothetical protein
MKTLLTTFAAVSALAIAAPAAAQQGYGNQGYGNQGYGNQGYGYGNGAGIENRIQRLEMRIEAGVQAGAIDRREARTLRQQLRDISRLERQYSRDGLDQRERADLQQRVRYFRDRLQMADGRGDGQYGNNGGYDDGYYGQGGPYEEAYCENDRRSGGGGLGGLGGGLGSIIDSIFGGNRNGNDDQCRALRVGQRAAGNLGAVPYQYRTQFRDGGGVYYRSDGRAIYQIDARTDTVLRVYDMNR